ncbi:hypothetical protein NDU88_007970 [Pleurodeles waltl]|uniref:Uncharacterized protein n=1 Tax=Pleurodeles waltl TaxID=8319 RepID=A0AAV7N4Z5_PLEWA|nr:hypothetical protein NDU88_007970 [Pleurodeles waltl]
MIFERASPQGSGALKVPGGAIRAQRPSVKVSTESVGAQLLLKGTQLYRICRAQLQRLAVHVPLRRVSVVGLTSIEVHVDNEGRGTIRHGPWRRGCWSIGQ